MNGRTNSSSKSAREFMSSGAPWVDYINSVLREVAAGISIDAGYKIDTGSYSMLELVEFFKKAGWSWPRRWYKRNRNRVHAGGIHLEKEVERGKWLHLIIVPGNGSGAPVDWQSPPQRIDLHAENHWLQPSSVRHFHDFVKERYIVPLLGMLGLAV